MNAKVINKGTFYVLGLKQPMDMPDENRVFTSSMVDELKRHNDIEPYGMLSVSPNVPMQLNTGGELFQIIGVASMDYNINGYDVLRVKSGQWVVFTLSGSSSSEVISAWDNEVSRWLYSNGFTHSGGPEIFHIDSKSGDSEIWIPVNG